jgi:16S rRNA G966 N2-methylase RsmD
VGKALRGLAEEDVTADFIFLDPPYRMEEVYGRALESLGESSLPQPGSLVIAEHEKKFDPGEGFASLHRFRKLEQGDAALSFYKKT